MKLQCSAKNEFSEFEFHEFGNCLAMYLINITRPDASSYMVTVDNSTHNYWKHQPCYVLMATQVATDGAIHRGLKHFTNTGLHTLPTGHRVLCTTFTESTQT